ncbi:MAG: rod shape-determining protein MreD [Betaproteobacteria bacterium]|nr:rod shape-determining protein MreD [Betaproteobacteria bacterium]
MALRPPQSHEILRPARPGFIALTLAAALFANLLPWTGAALLIKPDFLAVILLYWCVREPRKIGFAVAWLLGLTMDIGNATLFGQHALAYTLLAYAGVTLHRRVERFTIAQQTLQVVPMLLLVQVATLLVRMAAGADFPGLLYFSGSLTGAALWPLLSTLLPLPQRPKASPDQPAI